MQRRHLMQWAAASAGLGPLATSAHAQAGLKPGKPFAGATVNMLTVVAPQFSAHEAKLADFEALTSIQMVDVGKQVQAKTDLSGVAMYYGKTAGQNLMIWFNYLWGMGGDLLDAKGQPALNSPQGVAATQAYIDVLLRHKVAPPGSASFNETDAVNSMAQSKSAMVPVWWWRYAGHGRRRTALAGDRRDRGAGRAARHHHGGVGQLHADLERVSVRADHQQAGRADPAHRPDRLPHRPWRPVGADGRRRLAKSPRRWDMHLAGPGDAHFELPFFTFELLGDCALLTVKVGPHLLAIKTPKDCRLRQDQRVGIRFDTDRLFWFDSASGRRPR